MNVALTSEMTTKMTEMQRPRNQPRDLKAAHYIRKSKEDKSHLTVTTGSSRNTEKEKGNEIGTTTASDG